MLVFCNCKSSNVQLSCISAREGQKVSIVQGIQGMLTISVLHSQCKNLNELSCQVSIVKFIIIKRIAIELRASSQKLLSLQCSKNWSCTWSKPKNYKNNKSIRSPIVCVRVKKRKLWIFATVISKQVRTMKQNVK